MRIKDLATRATKLLTGNAYMVFDNGTKVEKVDYAELAKQIITEYNTQTLAGSAQSVKSALDALNSKPTVNSIQKNSISLDTLTTPGVYACNNCTGTPNGLTGWFNVQVLPNGSGGDGNANYALQIATPLESNDNYLRYCSNGTWTEWVKQPTRAEVDALNIKINTFYTKMLHSNEGTTVSFALTGRGTVLAIGNDSGSRPWIAVISMHGLTATGTIRMLVNDDDPSYNPVASFPSAKNCTLTVHSWEDILLISTVNFA